VNPHLPQLQQSHSMKSIKTTILSVLAALAIVIPEALTVFDDDPTTNPNFSLIFAAITAAGAGTAARDNNVSSESAGAK